MSDPVRGLYEVLITEALEARLQALHHGLSPRRTPLRPAEAADRIALHLGRLLQRTIQGLDDTQRVAAGINLARQLLIRIDALVPGAAVSSDAPIDARRKG